MSCLVMPQFLDAFLLPFMFLRLCLCFLWGYLGREAGTVMAIILFGKDVGDGDKAPTLSARLSLTVACLLTVTCLLSLSYI